MRKARRLMVFSVLLAIQFSVTKAKAQETGNSFSVKPHTRTLQYLKSSDRIFGNNLIGAVSQSTQAQVKRWEPTFSKTEPHALLVSEKQFVYRFVSALAISPNYANDKTIFVGVYNGGVYKSTDGGATWNTVNNGLAGFDITSLAISPAYVTDKTIFVGIKAESGSSANGILKSTNEGETWNLSGSFTPGQVENLALSPNFINDQTVFAATNGSAVMKSTDGGKTWRQHHPGHPQVWSVGISPNYAIDSTIFAGTLVGIFKSSNDGRSWVQTYGVTFSFDSYDVSCFGFSPSFAQDQTMFAGTFDGLQKSTDGGNSWTPILFESVAVIAMSPDYRNDQTMFAATAAGVFKSTNGGSSWITVNNGLTDFNVEALIISPNYINDHTIFAGTHEGVFKSSGIYPEWKSVNTGLLLTSGIENLTKSPYQLDTVPSIAVDATGNFHIAWWGTYASTTAPDGITTDAFYMRNRNGAFEPPVKIAVPTGYYSIDVSLAVDKDGYAHIAFRRGDGLSNAVNDDIYYATNKGGDFRSPILAVEGESWQAADPWNPSIAVDDNGNAHLAFDGLFTSPSQVFYSNNVSGIFTEPIAIPSPRYSLGGRPSLCLDNFGNAHIAYRGESDTDIWGDITYVNNVGGSFNRALNVSRREGVEERPSLALDNLGRPHIVYEDQNGTYYTKMEADSFASPVRISFAGGRPSIVMDYAGHAHISFGQGSYYATNMGGNISPTKIVVGLNTYNLNVGPRCISIGQDNVVHIIFSMKSNFIETDSNWDIYHLAFTAMTPPPAPTLVAPLNGTTGISTIPTLIWNASSTATSYRLQVSTSSSFSTTVVDQDGITGTSYSVTGLVNNAKYYWRVNATNAGGTSDWSSVWSFTTIMQSPSQVLLISPPNSAVIGIDSVLFTWRRSRPAIDRYWFELATNSAMANSVIDSTLTAADTTKIARQLHDKQNYWWRVKAKNAAGWGPFSEEHQFRIDIPTSVQADNDIPHEFSLKPNYPNPFNPETVIQYQLPKQAEVRLEIYNLLGELVRTLVDEKQPAGYYTVCWDGKDKHNRPVASGVYMYRLVAGEFVQVRKMILVR